MNDPLEDHLQLPWLGFGTTKKVPTTNVRTLKGQAKNVLPKKSSREMLGLLLGKFITKLASLQIFNTC